MAGDADVLIRIRNVLEGNGLKDAAQQLDGVIDKTKASAAASDQSGASQAQLSTAVGRTNTALAGLEQASTGGANSMRGIMQAAQAVVPVLGQVAAAGAAFGAGWRLGTLIDQWTGLSGKISNALVPIDKAAESGARLRDRLREAATVSMEKLRKDLSEISKSADQTADSLARAASEAGQIRGAEAGVERARIMAEMPEGPERDRKLADLDYQEKAAEAASQKKLAEEQIENRKKALAAAQAEANNAAVDVGIQKSTGADPARIREAQDRLRTARAAEEQAAQRVKEEEASQVTARRLADLKTQEADLSRTAKMKELDQREQQQKADAERKHAEKAFSEQKGAARDVAGEAGAAVKDALSTARAKAGVNADLQSAEASAAEESAKAAGVGDLARPVSGRSKEAQRRESLRQAALRERGEAADAGKQKEAVDSGDVGAAEQALGVPAGTIEGLTSKVDQLKDQALQSQSSAEGSMEQTSKAIQQMTENVGEQITGIKESMVAFSQATAAAKTSLQQQINQLASQMRNRQ